MPTVILIQTFCLLCGDLYSECEGDFCPQCSKNYLSYPSCFDSFLQLNFRTFEGTVGSPKVNDIKGQVYVEHGRDTLQNRVPDVLTNSLSEKSKISFLGVLVFEALKRAWDRLFISIQ
jgi:hypothetical protein